MTFVSTKTVGAVRLSGTLRDVVGTTATLIVDGSGESVPLSFYEGQLAAVGRALETTGRVMLEGAWWGKRGEPKVVRVDTLAVLLTMTPVVPHWRPRP